MKTLLPLILCVPIIMGFSELETDALADFKKESKFINGTFVLCSLKVEANFAAYRIGGGTNGTPQTSKAVQDCENELHTRLKDASNALRKAYDADQLKSAAIRDWYIDMNKGFESVKSQPASAEHIADHFITLSDDLIMKLEY